MKERDSLIKVVRLCFCAAFLWIAFGTAGSLTADDGRKQYDYPGRIAGGIAFDDDGGLWVADGVRSESTTKIYHLKDNKLIRTIDVPVKWIGSLAYGAGKLWATTGQVVQIDPTTGKVLKTIKVKAPTEHTGLASDGRTMWYCYRKRLARAGAVSRTTKGLSGMSFPKTYRAGALVFDGEDMWLLSHDYHSISRLGADNDITAEKGILIRADKKEHRLRDMDWDGKSFWISLTKRVGVNKHDNAIVKVDTVDYKLDSAIPHATVRINFPCEGTLILQRTKGSRRPRHYDSKTGEYSIPEGEYRVLEHAYFKTDNANFKWRVKVLDRGKLTVKADGKVRDVKIGVGLAGKLTIKPPTSRWQQGRYSLHFSIVDSTGAKIQLCRVLKTPEASFVMREKSGQKIASGRFFAGVDSYCGYHVRIPKRVEFPLSIKLSLDSGPFEVKLDEVRITELPKEAS
jgi:hypothetical protein